MTSSKSRFVHNPVTQVIVLSTLMVCAFVVACRVLLPQSETFRGMVTFLKSQPGPTHPAGKLRGGAPVTDRPRSERNDGPAIR
jgi:hypothetical protein